MVGGLTAKGHKRIFWNTGGVLEQGSVSIGTSTCQKSSNSKWIDCIILKLILKKFDFLKIMRKIIPNFNNLIQLHSLFLLALEGSFRNVCPLRLTI